MYSQYDKTSMIQLLSPKCIYVSEYTFSTFWPRMKATCEMLLDQAIQEQQMWFAELMFRRHTYTDSTR